MAEDRNQFKSIYGDAEDEFEIEDVSDETLTMPTHEVRAAREDELEEEIEEEREAEPDAERPAPADAAEPENRSAQPAVTEDAADHLPAHEEPDAYLDDELEGVSFEEDHVRYRDPEPAPKERTFYDEMSGMDDSDTEENDLDEDDDVSVLSYIGHAVLFTIPVIGTVLMLLYIIRDDKNVHLRHFAQIWLVTLLVIAIGASVAVTMFGLA